MSFEQGRILNFIRGVAENAQSIECWNGLLSDAIMGAEGFTTVSVADRICNRKPDAFRCARVTERLYEQSQFLCRQGGFACRRRLPCLCRAGTGAGGPPRCRATQA